MLKRLFNRRRLSPAFLEDFADWLLVAGWVLFDAGSTFAVVRVTAVENWPRVLTKPTEGTVCRRAVGSDFSGHICGGKERYLTANPTPVPMTI